MWEVKVIYSNFAYIYDRLMYDVDYKEWANYIESIFKLHGIKPALILDLGCGTGNFSIEMARRGYDMIGVDSSPDMLSCAMEKSAGINNVLYLNQDMTDFELYGTVDIIVCLMDSINYILKKRDIKKIFKLVKNYLNPGGLFIFDINTPYKFENVFKDNVYYDVSDEVTYIWQNHFDRKNGICEFDLTFFIKDNEGYEKYEELHYERCYKVQELKKMIDESGLSLMKVYDSLKLSPPTKKSERIFFVCKK
ncbi:MAG: class I SAM-dependent DNA methyltransferase [Bacillota bacterium]